MRLAVIGLAVYALAAGVQSSSAVEGNSRWCTQSPGGSSSGEMICSYNTWEQCREAAAGGNRYCTENPAIAWAKRGVGTWPEPPVKGNRRN